MTASLPLEAPFVAVLMATYNGAANLQAQLDSLAAQSLPPRLVMVSDDGSQDETAAIVRAFGAAHPELSVQLRRGPCAGAAKNFLALLRDIPQAADFVALCDQDDIWLPGKIAAGVRQLRSDGGSGPRLYCGRTWEVREDLSQRRMSRGARKPAGFRHALVQNIAGGNTMILDRQGAELIRAAARLTDDVVVHDWWVYLVICATGGQVLFDPQPQMLYRQHDGNLIGANRGPRAMATRLGMLLSGRFRDWCSLNIAALRKIEARMTPENRALLEHFATGRRGTALQRLAMVWQGGFYRQGMMGQISLYLAAILGRL